ncbi:hypothetical protein [Agrococcus sp. Ld7]|uniref:hypothetical protein n=1 Tax=Agrococcus sp. Ld7 TaxID=649148 RepID=UPI00386C0D75
MPNRLAIAAGVVAVLAVSACGAVTPPVSFGPSSQGASGSASETGDGGSELRVSPRDGGDAGVPRASGASVDDVLRLGAVATWVDGGEQLAISLPAEERCWPTAGDPAVLSPTRISIEFSAEPVCDAPSTARTYTMDVPEGIDASAGVEIVVEGLSEPVTLSLPAT